MKFMTYPERKGFEKGIEKGIAKGKQEERAEGHNAQVELLSHVLKHRFGALPDDRMEKLREGSREQILAWTDKALDADELDDVFK